MDFGGILYMASVWVLPVLLAVTLHEAAHGYVALRFGDDTALRAGRVTLNPFRHVDRGPPLLPKHGCLLNDFQGRADVDPDLRRLTLRDIVVLAKQPVRLMQ